MIYSFYLFNHFKSILCVIFDNRWCYHLRHDIQPASDTPACMSISSDDSSIASRTRRKSKKRFEFVEVSIWLCCQSYFFFISFSLSHNCKLFFFIHDIGCKSIFYLIFEIHFVNKNTSFHEINFFGSVFFSISTSFHEITSLLLCFFNQKISTSFFTIIYFVNKNTSLHKIIFLWEYTFLPVHDENIWLLC